ncbi:unnamed protein product [Triticum turgidum subsp. durum]|uniref:Late embryogenesis abundant protein LEA-2 subgroup domain-containing protein n=1 Tax=Triticum turgidum subsp. durum TaxID=4567 RepID=A0A9R1AI34_TRITD|nr:unnamed protein product [Triticum turgidum subsp. durum]
MSLITDDPDRSPRDCATKRHHHHHHHHHSGGWRQRRLLIAASSGAASLLALCIILWLTLRPSAPRFTLLAATATSSNASTGGGLVRLDAALMAHNPNAPAAALYDGLRARAPYAGFQLATAGPLPPFQQAQGDAVLSASLSSAAAASAEGAADGRSQALLRLRIEGRLRWKVAAWVSGERALAAECVAVAAPSQLRAVVVQGTECAVTIE